MVLLRFVLALVAAVSACDSEEREPPREPDAGSRDSGAHEEPAKDADAGVDETPWRALFDAQFSQLYRFLPSHGRDVDPDGVFEIEDGVLHVLGNAPPSGGQEQEFGYVGTREEYGNYQLRLEQKWGTTKFAPRADAVRDSGLLYHMRGSDFIWPQSVEFQIQENDIGDLFLLSGTGSTTRVDPNRMDVFQEGGVERTLRDQAIRKSGTMESLTDWNSLHLIASGRDWVHIVNGYLGHRGIAAEYREGESWLPLDRGRILLQAEGAEVFYRNLRIRPLAYTPPPADAVVLFDGASLDAFEHAGGKTAQWTIVDGALEIVPGTGDLVTREAFSSLRLHVEFRLPRTTEPNAEEQARANSGVFLHDRYEVQVLDSFGRALEGRNDAAAIYDIRDASSNEAFPAELWQTYDIVFRARTQHGPARISVFWNGTEVQHEVELPDAETPDRAPVRLQDHASPVRYRNIWLKRL